MPEKNSVSITIDVEGRITDCTVKEMQNGKLVTSHANSAAFQDNFIAMASGQIKKCDLFFVNGAAVKRQEFMYALVAVASTNYQTLNLVPEFAPMMNVLNQSKPFADTLKKAFSSDHLISGDEAKTLDTLLKPYLAKPNKSMGIL